MFLFLESSKFRKRGCKIKNYTVVLLHYNKVSLGKFIHLNNAQIVLFFYYLMTSLPFNLLYSYLDFEVRLIHAVTTHSI